MRSMIWVLVAACSSSAPTSDPVAPKQKRVFGKRDGDRVKKHDLAELERPAEPKLLDIDWSTVELASTADALALWARIAPTGLDWEDKLGELPSRVERPLAFALLEGGNFQCMPAVAKKDCAVVPLDVREPAHAAGFTDPCLRRLLALWALDKVEDSDLRRAMPALRAIAALPPPESELVAAALATIPEDAHALRLELLAIAQRAGQHDVVIGKHGVGRLDEAHLIEAVTKHHIDGAVEILSADGHRSTYLAAVTDEHLATKTRTAAMHELVATDPTGAIAADVKAALVKATASKDCTVAATAAHLLARAGDSRFRPARPNARTPDQMMRSLCVLASYEQLAGAGEPSLLANYVPAKGLEKLVITYDPLGDTDTDGDGDPHTERTMDLVPRTAVSFPEIDDVVEAFRHCTNTTCKTDDRELRFVIKRIGGTLRLTRIEIADRPPCPS